MISRKLPVSHRSDEQAISFSLGRKGVLCGLTRLIHGDGHIGDSNSADRAEEAEGLGTLSGSSETIREAPEMVKIWSRLQCASSL